MTQKYCNECLCGEWAAGPICECGNCNDCCTCADDECDCTACQHRRENHDPSAEDQALYEAENDQS